MTTLLSREMRWWLPLWVVVSRVDFSGLRMVVVSDLVCLTVK